MSYQWKQYESGNERDETDRDDEDVVVLCGED